MNRANLALVEGGSDRAALAAAIAAVVEAERDLAATREALETATDKRWDAEEALEKLTNPDDDDAGDDRGAAFVASVRKGLPADVDELGGAAVGTEKAIAKAERAVATWKKTRQSCEAMLPEKEAALSQAKHAVDEAAAGVMRDAGLVGGLLSGLAELAEEFFRRRLLLHFLACHKLVPESRQADVKAALAPLPLPGNPDAVFYCEWYQRADYLEFARALEALRRDANAHIPGVG